MTLVEAPAIESLRLVCTKCERHHMNLVLKTAQVISAVAMWRCKRCKNYCIVDLEYLPAPDCN